MAECVKLVDPFKKLNASAISAHSLGPKERGLFTGHSCYPLSPKPPNPELINKGIIDISKND